MNPQLAWYAARAAGIVAWLLLSAAVVWGLLLSTRVLKGRPTPRWLLDLHRFLGGLAVTFTLVHIGALVADNYIHFGIADLLVPFASGWRPGPVALGVVGLWLLLAVEITSLMMRWLPRRLWHGIHLSSYLLFWTATLHGLLAGTDAHNPLYVLAADSVITVVLCLSLVRVLADRRRGRRATTVRQADPSRRRPRTAAIPAIDARDASTAVYPTPPPWGQGRAHPVRVSPAPSPPARLTGPGGPAAEELPPALAQRARALATRRRPSPEQRETLVARHRTANHRSATSSDRPTTPTR